ncbi:hypothetical protein K2Z83_08510 [Oscillochloris sp. ZM17-4]|uniref:hypothetical protein n=1 Tax=Oscillochloris sp. ZM17-4 TaxID=2866714 RepID=UPI001C72A75F|nr:hypothetical protein [Oscillochloris sp. ZM17-4]MBX0327716.1 hypothetical protein [Oscillochloris sp. ZM17-4]
MSHLALFHARLQVTITLALAALLLWGLVCALRGAVGRGYTAALWVVGLLIIAEGLLGLPLLLSSARPARLALHIVYGAVAAALLPGAIAYSRGRSGRWEALTYAAICLFLLGVAARAYQTGGAG